MNKTADKTVGVIGLGIMGGAIARNLTERGWHVIGFDIDAGARAENWRKPASATSPLIPPVWRGGEIIMTSLPSPAAAVAVACEIAEIRAGSTDRGRALDAQHRRQARVSRRS